MSNAVKFWMSFLLASLTAYGGVLHLAAISSGRDQRRRDHRRRQRRASRPTTVSDVKLTDSNGKPFSLDSLKGDVWLASFFFTSLPRPVRQMNRVHRRTATVNIPNKDLKFVSITCDPANDTPKRLAEYAKTFQAEPKRWFFLTGPLRRCSTWARRCSRSPSAPQSTSSA